MAIVLVIAIGGIGGFLYFKSAKGKKSKPAGPDPDEDYYIGDDSLLDDSFFSGSTVEINGNTYYIDENGEWIGFDADMAKGFAQKLGVEVEFVEIDWDNKALELDAKSIDCVWNGMTITPEREENMQISIPYMENKQAVVVAD